MKRIIIALVILNVTTLLFSQGVTLTGTVMDEKTGEPLAGVVVKHVSSGMEVITDFDGNYSFNNILPGYNKLKISYISYQVLELNRVTIKEDETNTLNISLKREGSHASPRNFYASNDDEEGMDS